jgi:hypothetical protein
MKQKFQAISSKLYAGVVLASSNGTSFSIKNPLGSDNLDDLFSKLAGGVLNIAIPVAVLMIVWAGFKYLTAAGNASKVKEANEILKWTVVGLAVIFIGGGFIDLIKSVLSGGQ